MSGKYDKYFITETPPHPDHPQSRNIVSDVPWCDSLCIINELGGTVEGAYYLETCMVLRTGTIDYLEESHTHDFPEYLLFLGTNHEDQIDLSGEVEVWMDDEQHTLNHTCAVLVPPGVPHCPMIVHRDNQPIIFIITGPGLGREYDGQAADSAPR